MQPHVGGNTGSMRRNRRHPARRKQDAAVAAAARCYVDLYGTTRAWDIWAATKESVNNRNYEPLAEIRRSSEHAVEQVLGHVPAGSRMAGFNAFMEEPGDRNPLSGIIRRFLRGEDRRDIEARIREKALDSKKKKN